jgi:DNA repair protein RadC
MPRPTPSASEEDIDVSRIRLLDPHAIAAYVKDFMQAPTDEWLAALLLDPQQYLIERDPRVLYLGRECPVHAYVDRPACFHEARDAGAHTLITVRYHPHGPRILREEDYTHYRAFRLEAKAHGVPLRNHLTLHSTGEMLSWRDWGKAYIESGTSASISAASRAWASAPMTVILMALMGST